MKKCFLAMGLVVLTVIGTLPAEPGDIKIKEPPGSMTRSDKRGKVYVRSDCCFPSKGVCLKDT
jgi:hypothetical protein